MIFFYRERRFGVWSAKYEDEGAKIYNDYFYVTFGTIAVRTKNKNQFSTLFLRMLERWLRILFPELLPLKYPAEIFFDIIL